MIKKRELGLVFGIFIILASLIPLPTVQAEPPTTRPADNRVLMLEDFEKPTDLPEGLKIVDASTVKPLAASSKIAELGGQTSFSGFDVPVGAKMLHVSFKRLFLVEPTSGCSAHFTRQYVRFNTTGEQRFGEGLRAPLTDSDAGKWTDIKADIPVADGATSVTLLEMSNIVEGGNEGYKNPVYIDDVKVAWD